MRLLGEEYGNAFYARVSKLARPAIAFLSHPEPRTIGSVRKGQQLLEGQFLYGGVRVDAADTSIWQLGPQPKSFEDAIQGFTWLDHLVAEGSPQAKELARKWVWEWIDRYGGGNGPGWVPDVTGRRVSRWISHSIMLLQAQEPSASRSYFKSLGHQAKFLSYRWRAAEEGLPRFEALSGLALCGLLLETRRSYLGPALKSLGREAGLNIGVDGAIKSRNPEELLSLFSLLVWTAQVITDGENTPDREHLLAIERIAPALRALRLGDGSLAQFHGGSRGARGRLDRALAEARVKRDAVVNHAMGFERLAQGDLVLVMDRENPPETKNAHSSRLAFELSIGRDLLFVNSGPGALFGPKYAETGAQMQAHSTVSVMDQEPSSSAVQRLDNLFSGLYVSHTENSQFEMLIGRHVGYVEEFGLTHVRSIELAKTAQMVRGRDRLFCDSETARQNFKGYLKAQRRKAVSLFAHFHLAPNVGVEETSNPNVLQLKLPNGAAWEFETKNAKLSVHRSVYMAYGELAPTATKQIVATSTVNDYEGVIDWVLKRR